MYSIYADDICIYDDSFTIESMKALNPKLTLEDNAAGSLSLTLTPQNAGYSSITRLISDISVRKDGIELWAGRVLSENMDFWNNRILYCEGELSFFNDSIQPPAEYPNTTIREYLQRLIAVHNSKVDESRRFTLGAVTVHDDNTLIFYTNYEKTMEKLNALIEIYGGHMRVRKENGVRYLDYLENYQNTCTQVIRFGTNLIDFTKQWDMTEFATVIIPLGTRLDDSEIEALDAYLTVESVNGGSIYVASEDEAIAAYGRIEKTVSWSDEEDAGNLLRKARAYLSELQFDNMVLELSALDLHYLNVEYEAVKLLDEIRVISPPHGLNRLFPVTKLDIPLDSPEKAQFKLGDTVRVSLTSVNNQMNTTILQKIEELPKAHSILKEARENAAAIMDLATNGFITIIRDNTGSEALIISSERDYTIADRYWKWNMNGLAYYNRNQDSGQSDLPIAITMDGSIVADYITTGTMSADRIRTGILESAGENRTYDVVRDSSGNLIKDNSGNDIESRSDKFGNVVFNLNEGTLKMRNGSIQLGEYSDGHYQFEVDDQGHLYAGASAIFAGTLNAAKGSFGGALVAATGNFKGIVQASDFLDSLGNSMMEDQKFKSDYLSLKGLTIVNSSNQPVMRFGENGVTIYGGRITWGSSISFNNISGLATVATTGDYDDLDSLPDIPPNVIGLDGKIKSTYIDEKTIVSPTIVGGTFYATDDNQQYLKITSAGIQYYKKSSSYYTLDWYLETISSSVVLGSSINAISLSSAAYINLITNTTTIDSELILKKRKSYGSDAEMRSLSPSTGMIFFVMS